MTKKRRVKIFYIIILAIFSACSSVTDKQFEQWANIENTKVMSLIEHKQIEHNGNRIHYYTSGEKDGDVILFLHPAFANHQVFNQQIDYFSSKYKVITIDLIGHGLSYAENSSEKIDKSIDHIKLILQKEGYSKVHLVGISMGSLIAQYFALQNPNNILSLTVLGGYDINKINDDVVAFQSNEKWKWLFQALFSMDSFRKDVAAMSVTNIESQARFYEMTKQFTRKSFMIMSGLDKIIQNRENIKIDYPLLILSGENDVPLALEMAEKFHKNIPGSKYFLIKNAGHCANMDNENEFNKILMGFLEDNH